MAKASQKVTTKKKTMKHKTPKKCPKCGKFMK